MTQAHSRLRSFDGVRRPLGAVMIGVGVAMAICGITGFLWDRLLPSSTIPEGGALACGGAALIAIALGFGIGFMFQLPGERERLSRREALLAVTLIWIMAAFCGALPFAIAGHMSPIDAIFESISALTTTGASVVFDIETRFPRALLLWRAMGQWLGGMGIVVLFVAVFPNLGAGAKLMYRNEAPGASSDGFRPRIAETSITLWKIYIGLTVILTVILSLLGMDPFEAICHALSTIATGGFSTRDASIGAFNSAAYEWVIACFMLISSLNFGLFYLAFRGRTLRDFVRNVELRAFALIVAIAVAIMTLVHLTTQAPLDALRHALFLVSSTVSSTGFTTSDATQLPFTATVILIALMFVGGCSGSTAGGIKIERIVMLGKQTLAQIRRSFDPSVVQIVRMGRSVVSSEILSDVAAFFVIYMLCLGSGVFVIVTIEGIPSPTAFGAMLSALSNMGPMPFHDLAGYADNFASFSAPSKLFFCVAMLLGRLEFFTIFALLMPGFWRR